MEKPVYFDGGLEMLGARDTADKLNITRARLYQQISAGVLNFRSSKVRGRRYFVKADVDAYITKKASVVRDHTQREQVKWEFGSALDEIRRHLALIGEELDYIQRVAFRLMESDSAGKILGQKKSAPVAPDADE